MLTQVPAAEPRLHCRRHATLLAATILGIALTRGLCTHTPIGLAFAGYGALHGASVVICLRPRPVRVWALAFVATASLLSGSMAHFGFTTVPLLARSGVERAALVVVAVSAFAGAFGYGALLRYWLRFPLAPGRLLMIAFACTFAACAALVPMRQYPAGGTAWLAILWWLAFSGGLCAAARREPRAP